MNNAEQKPAVTNLAEITKHFFEHSPIDESKGYELLGAVSDAELEIFDHITATNDIGAGPTKGIVMAQISQKSTGRKLVAKLARYDDGKCPIIAMALFEMKPHEHQEELIESFALFTDEHGEGFNPIEFKTHSADDPVAIAVRESLKS